MITKTDFIGIPCTDPERSRAFYVETLGLRPDEPASATWPSSPTLTATT